MIFKPFTFWRIKASIVNNTKKYYRDIENAFQCCGYILSPGDKYYIFHRCYSFVKYIETFKQMEKFKEEIYELDYEAQDLLKDWVIENLFDNQVNEFEEMGIYSNQKFDSWMNDWTLGLEKYFADNKLENLPYYNLFVYTLNIIKEYFNEEKNYERISEGGTRKIVNGFNNQLVLNEFEFKAREINGTLPFIN